MIASSAAMGDTLTISLNDIAINPDWNAANCQLVAYVYNTSTNEVLQAAERQFQP